MKKTASFLTAYIIRKGIIEDDERNIYEYGFLTMLELGTNILLSAIIAGMLHMMFEGLLFFLIFIPLRAYAGGLHMNRYGTCLVFSCLTFFAVLEITATVSVPVWISMVCILLLNILVYFLYPVENINRTVDNDEDNYFKKRLRMFLVLDIAISGACLLLNKDRWLVLITVTFLLVVITMGIGKIRYALEESKAQK
ncbi:MAG: accessory gene regulator B family protein [Lachnospiraceae bacterium]|nr:accessory gene regulator B family protein [Lachnospiraceae bacterium]